MENGVALICVASICVVSRFIALAGIALLDSHVRYHAHVLVRFGLTSGTAVRTVMTCGIVRAIVSYEDVDSGMHLEITRSH